MLLVGIDLGDNSSTAGINNQVGKKIELWETLKGLEVRYGNKLFDIVEDYWEKIKKRSKPSNDLKIG